MYLTPGQIFVGRYRVDRFVAEGGMGAVYAGMHETTEARVAIKVLRPAMLVSPAVARQFELEAKVAARVRSPYIVQVLDAGKDPETGLSYLVMELLDGKSLENLVNENGPLGPERVVRFLEQVAAGLEKAHSYRDENGEVRPIVHRDLKPDNLFVEGLGTPNPTVKILDFGIAKVLSSTAGVSQDLRGTPLYMAYEQATGKAVSPQTDIWALGLIAFYLLTGKAFWKSALGEGTLASLVGEITIEPKPPASERLRELGSELSLPPGFDAWLQRCLERDAQLRYRSAIDAVIHLAEALGVEPRPLSEVGNSAPPTMVTPDSLKETVPVGSVETGSTGELSVASTHSPTTASSGLRRVWLVGAAVAVAAAAWYVLAGNSAPDSSPTDGNVAASAGQPTTEQAPSEPTSEAAAPSGGSAGAPSTAAPAASTDQAGQPSVAPVEEAAKDDTEPPLPKPAPKTQAPKPSPSPQTPKAKTGGEDKPAPSPSPDPYGER